MEFDSFDFNFDEFFTSAGQEEKKQEATAKEEPKTTETPAPASENTETAAKEQVISDVNGIAAAETETTAETNADTSAKTDTEERPETEAKADVEANATVGTEADMETNPEAESPELSIAPEEDQEEGTAETKTEDPVQETGNTATEQTVLPMKEEGKSTSEPEEEKIEVEVTKPKRRGRKKKTEEKPTEETSANEEKKLGNDKEKPVEKEKSIPESENATAIEPIRLNQDIDEGFLKELNCALGQEFVKERETANKMLNDIAIAHDMSPENVRIMQQKLDELRRHMLLMTEKYTNSYNMLTSKDGGLMAQVRSRAEDMCSGSATDKKNAGNLALMNYRSGKGNKVNLMTYSVLLKNAKEFCDRMNEYVKATSIALSTALKIDPSYNL